MKTLRKTLFWLHLAAGLLAGSIIGIMSFTGVILAFEHQIVEWAERDARRVTVPPEATALPLDEILARAAEFAETETPASGLTVLNDPEAAIAVRFGRGDPTVYVNPYTGDARVPSTGVHDFMHLMIDWHRWLALSGDQRSTGRALTGASNLVFLFLAVSGLYLWWPRSWRWKAVKASLLFTSAKGKARDWNWHNVYGVWSLPVLIVLIVTGAVISYPWASNLAYRVVGESPPPPRGSPAATSTEDTDTSAGYERPEGASAIPFDAARDQVAAAFPDWTQITLREGLPRRRGAPPRAPTKTPGADALPLAEPYSATVKTETGPVFASSQIVLNPYTGAVLSRTGFEDNSTGRKVRSWLRFLHTGEALGWPGQLVAGMASFGGVVLVYTGFALSWRRFFGKNKSKKKAAPIS